MNPFEVLGVPNNTPVSVVKHFFRKLSMVKHPDKGGDEGEYKKILSAYSKISCGYKVPEKKRKSAQKKNTSVTYAKAVVSIDDAAYGCYADVPVGNDCAYVFVPAWVLNGEHLQFKGMGALDRQGVNGTLDILVELSLPDGFTFEKYLGRDVLVYNIKLERSSIPKKITIPLFKRRKVIYLPKKLRDGMFLKVLGWGYPKGEPLFVRIIIK